MELSSSQQLEEFGEADIKVYVTFRKRGRNSDSDLFAKSRTSQRLSQSVYLWKHCFVNVYFYVTIYCQYLEERCQSFSKLKGESCAYSLFVKNAYNIGGDFQKLVIQCCSRPVPVDSKSVCTDRLVCEPLCILSVHIPWSWWITSSQPFDTFFSPLGQLDAFSGQEPRMAEEPEWKEPEAKVSIDQTCLVVRIGKVSAKSK
ncbi:hypothetical protein STEG23_028067 [Scotinomys teguina]